VLRGGQKVDLEVVAVMRVSFTRIERYMMCGWRIPFGDTLDAGGRVRALGGIDVGSDLLLNIRVDAVVDKNNVDSGLIGAVLGQL
jgi:hypothetical protein